MLIYQREKIEKAEKNLRVSLIFPFIQALLAVCLLVFQILELTVSLSLVFISIVTLLMLYFSLKQFEEASYDVIIKIFPVILIFSIIGGLGISSLFVYSSYKLIKEVFHKRVQVKKII
ncbi:MAG: hypothetical protein B6U95_05595 [Thermofilum sp. ex4484_82]|nr:MAG: hypothetical protein B6U95_05595 [Thermofilum sp. ex4484_82]OYT37901.1 MAG: hypothetical protein B6U96_05590 [Archaeoglobales archaeon ex4484_92]